eukprot:1484372-Alexandrium_andersonii.AAC.1
MCIRDSPFPARDDHPPAAVGLDQDAGDVAGGYQKVRKDRGLGGPSDVRRQVINISGCWSPRRIRGAHDNGI